MVKFRPLTEPIRFQDSFYLARSRAQKKIIIFTIHLTMSIVQWFIPRVTIMDRNHLNYSSIVNIWIRQFIHLVFCAVRNVSAHTPNKWTSHCKGSSCRYFEHIYPIRGSYPTRDAGKKKSTLAGLIVSVPKIIYTYCISITQTKLIYFVTRCHHCSFIPTLLQIFIPITIA